MQTFRLGSFKGGLSTGLVVPGFEGGAWFHCRKNVDQTRVITALGDDRLDTLLLPKVVAPDELDDQTVLLGEYLGVSADLFSKRLGEQGVVKEANAIDSQVPRHGLCMADISERAGNHHPVEAGQGAMNLGCMPIYKRIHGGIIAQSMSLYQEDGAESLFGSG